MNARRSASLSHWVQFALVGLIGLAILWMVYLSPSLVVVAVPLGLVIWLGLAAINHNRRAAERLEEIAYGEASTYRRYRETK